MRVSSYNDDYGPQWLQPSVIVDRARESLVLDQTGEPYYLKNKMKIGFDLTKKTKEKTNGI